MKNIVYKPIGIIRTPFKTNQGAPIQSAVAVDTKGRVEIFPEFVDGLSDLEGFSHVILLYHFHLSKKSSLKVRPFLDRKRRGVFATRAPSHPNSIGLSVVRLLNMEKEILSVDHIDILNGTPLLDIKPYIPKFDGWEVSGLGWIERQLEEADKVKDDGRFAK
jgi:tRNA-Thr(GGU) m(6)t(6)A37 methyltransferase TsaA